MRGWTAIVAILAMAPTGAVAQEFRQERQATLDAFLSSALVADIEQYRAACASGSKVTSIARSRSLGAVGLPDAADYCVTVLIRLAREGRLVPLRDSRPTATTPAIALDTGFVAGYAAPPSPAPFPSMTVLKPIAERCLAQAEPNIRLCYSTGYAFGGRAARGEVVRVQ